MRLPLPWRKAPLYVLEPAVVRGLAARFHLAHLFKRFPERAVWALFMFLSGFVTIGSLTVMAMLSRTAFIFPPLGASAFLLFHAPSSAAASPRNTVYGHALGIISGYIALWVTNLEHAGPALADGVTPARVIACALSLALSGALMILAKAPHPPAAATTLVISLGIVVRPAQLGILELAVFVLTAQAIIINRFAGLNYPYWAFRASPVPVAGPAPAPVSRG
jgi:CBS-domain-containing membrane protein